MSPKRYLTANRFARGCKMSILLSLFYTLCLVAFILFIIIIEKYKRRTDLHIERANHLEDVLSSAPMGFYLQITANKITHTLCSRRLCLMLNLLNTSSDFDTVLGTLSPGSQRDLTEKFDRLKQNGTSFELVVQNSLNLMHLKVSGAVLKTPYPEQQATILWFENISYTTAQFTQSTLKYKQLSDEKEIILGALNQLPFPLMVENDKGDLVFGNKTLSHEPGDNADLHWQDLKFETSLHNVYRLKYGQDKTTEQGLKALLEDARLSHLNALKEVPCPVCLFDANTRLTFANKHFIELWKLDSAWVKREPFYEEFLNKLQEKGYLPQVKDFALYKKEQKDLFSRLTKTHEEFLYLPNGRIVRRQMIPHAQGGILFIDEIKVVEH